jgi:choline dehydrogenase-like flavoprotein
VRDGAFRRDRAPFRIEISNTGWNWPNGDPAGTTHELVDRGLFGRTLRARLRSRISRQILFASLVEQTPDESNRVTLSPHPDRLGIPRPQIAYDLSGHTRAGFAAARRVVQRVFEHLGATDCTTDVPADDEQRFVYAGHAYKLYGAGHAMGTFRMGHDRAASVVTANLRTHDHPNLFLLGSGVFPAVGTANPTLTIAALALRAAETIALELRGR